MVIFTDELVCMTANYPAAPSPLTDSGTWDILEQYLTTDMTYPQMEEAFSAYLGMPEMRCSLVMAVTASP